VVRAGVGALGLAAQVSVVRCHKGRSSSLALGAYYFFLNLCFFFDSNNICFQFSSGLFINIFNDSKDNNI
jgi:hypothetical protein